MLHVQLLALPVLVLTAATGATAQQSPALTSGPPPAMFYRSAFDHYETYKEQNVGSWVQANDTVRQIGGWRAYANEAQGKVSPASGVPASVTPDTTPVDRAPPRSVPGTANPHTGHHR